MQDPGYEPEDQLSPGSSVSPGPVYPRSGAGAAPQPVTSVTLVAASSWPSRVDVHSDQFCAQCHITRVHRQR